MRACVHGGEWGRGRAGTGEAEGCIGRVTAWARALSEEAPALQPLLLTPGGLGKDGRSSERLRSGQRLSRGGPELGSSLAASGNNTQP